MPNPLRTFAKRFLGVACFVLFLNTAALAQTSTITYQGRLADGGTAANGTYDLQFKVYDALTNGNQIPTGSPVTVTRTGVNVTNGIFTVQLDFGAGAFPGADRYLDIRVKHPADSSNTPLVPRQQLTSSPYAIRSLTAATSDTASNATQLGGVAANQYVQTNDSRLSDARTPTAGSSNYIQNSTNQQASSNFNINGNGIVGGSFNVDQSGANDGALTNGLTFGQTGTGEGIASKRTSGGNQFGLDFFTNSQRRMSLTNNGRLGIGTPTPQYKLDVRGDIAIGNISNGFVGSNSLLLTSNGDSQNVFEIEGYQNKFTFIAHSLGGSTHPSGISFWTTPSPGNETERLSIDQNGNVNVTNGNLTVASGVISGNGSSLTSLNAGNISTGTLDNARLGTVPTGNGGTGITSAPTAAGQFLRSTGSGAWGISAGDSHERNTEPLDGYRRQRQLPF